MKSFYFNNVASQPSPMAPSLLKSPAQQPYDWTGINKKNPYYQEVMNNSSPSSASPDGSFNPESGVFGDFIRQVKSVKSTMDFNDAPASPFAVNDSPEAQAKAAQTANAMNAASAAERQPRGRASTILTSPYGLSGLPSLARRTLMGS